MSTYQQATQEERDVGYWVNEMHRTKIAFDEASAIYRDNKTEDNERLKKDAQEAYQEAMRKFVKASKKESQEDEKKAGKPLLLCLFTR